MFIMKRIPKIFLTLSAVVVAGIFIRLGAVFYACGPPPATYPTMDEMNFRELAVNVLDYRVFASWTEGFYTTSTRAPVYPLMIACAYSLSGERAHHVPKYLNLFFDTINILLVFVLANALFGAKFATLAAAAYSIFGHAPYFMAISSPHTLGLLLLMSVCIAITALNKHYISATVALSLLYTLLLHTRPVFLVALPFLFPCVWLQLTPPEGTGGFWGRAVSEPLGKTLKSLLPICIILALCLPWGIRNYRAHNTIVPVSIISGWHISSNENRDMRLSIQYLVEQLYRPERKNFTEGEYFREARAKLRDAFSEAPFSFIGFGTLRLVAGWCPQEPHLRFFDPKAYVFPLRVINGLVLPLPDFEGLLYIFTASCMLALIMSFRKTIDTWSAVLVKTRGLAVLALGYSAVHVIGIPLVAYLFLLEPIIGMILIATMLFYAGKIFASIKVAAGPAAKLGAIMSCPTEAQEPSSTRYSLCAAYAVASVIILMIIIPLAASSVPKPRTYFALLQPRGLLNYSQIRELQWENSGRIPPGVNITTQGVVRYSHSGFKFITDDYRAVPDKDYSAARLFVHYGDKNNPLGIGDARLNFHHLTPPQDEQAISLTGSARNGLFGEIIIDVQSFSDLFEHDADPLHNKGHLVE